MEYQLRLAGSQDVSEIVAFIRELAEYEKMSQEMVATEEMIHESLFGEKPAAEVVIASVDEQAAGFALFFTNYSTFLGRPGLYLEDLFVRPAYRGHGLGCALLQHLAGIARKRGYGRMEWSVLDWNKPAIDFYERMGAVAMDEWITYRVTGSALQAMSQESG